MGDDLKHNQNRDVWRSIQVFNRQHDRAILELKYAKMRKNAFGFFRGTCHLFYRDLPSDSELNTAPVIWICGDLHLENFGAYKGDNRQIYFGIDDFDEGILAPCTWDLARLVTSIFLAVDSLDLKRSAATALAQLYLTSYTTAISSGKVSEIVADNAKGIVADLLADLHRRKRSDFLDERTELIAGRRHLKIDDKKILKISKQRSQQVGQSIDLWAKTQANPDFFQVLDVGGRVAGTGSLGFDRYLILVTGQSSPHGNYLLDFKQQLDSSLQPYLPEPFGQKIKQPEWANSATRVLTVQQLVQSTPPALLAAIKFNDRSYLLRELQPTQDKIGLKAGKISLSQLEKLIDIMAQVTAFTHLQGSGKLGAVITADLVTFGTNSTWQQSVINYAANYAKQVQIDYQDFCQATPDL
jgi:uncharacterized protein (DUF2252 family)